MVFGLTCRSLIRFEFIFLYGIGKWSSFILLHAAVQFFQHHLLKRLFPIAYSFLLCWRLIDYIIMGLFLSFLFCSIDLYVYFCAITMLFWLLPLCNITWSLESWYLQLCFAFQNCFGNSRSFLKNHRYSTKKKRKNY